MLWKTRKYGSAHISKQFSFPLKSLLKFFDKKYSANSGNVCCKRHRKLKIGTSLIKFVIG